LPGAAFALTPENLKPTADRELVDGANLFVVHTSVHQPLNHPGPGVTLGFFGQWFTRNETWAEQAGPWVTYLARSSYLLQQGCFVADVVYFYGQDSNVTALYDKQLPKVPEGYAFDFANAHALTQLSAGAGLITTGSGMRYRVIALDPRASIISFDALSELARLVAEGATVVGNRPRGTPSLADKPAAFRSLVDALWGMDDTKKHRYGKGWVFSGELSPEVLSDLKIAPDFSYSKPSADTSVGFVHRRLEDTDLYFVNNRRNHAELIEARFRIGHKAAELWRADTGVIEPASFRNEGDSTVVPLHLAPNDAVFVVFHERSQRNERRVAESDREPLAAVTGPWQVHFQAGRGAPNETTLTELTSLTTSPEPGIKYFSGTASYTTSLNVHESWFAPGQPVEIDLGRVKNVAEVLVEGASAGIAWKSPYRLNVTRLLKPGINRITIRVSNLWPNRLIGDKQPNTTPVAFTTFNPYSADSPLLEAGLLGPVTIQRVQVRHNH